MNWDRSRSDVQDDAKSAAERALERHLHGGAARLEGIDGPPSHRLLLPDPGTRLVTVDLETGQATELPWEAGSAPSWQRVAVD